MNLCPKAMNCIFLPSSLSLLPTLHQSKPCLRIQPRYSCCFNDYSSGHKFSSLSLRSPFISFHSLRNRQSSIGATIPSNEGAISMISMDDFKEKDWSFLESDETNSDGELNQKTDRIISAGGIGETSKVLVSIGSKGFVDRIVDSSPCQMLLVVHDSIFVLANIKAKYDMVKCWQGELLYVPEKWAPFDVVYLYFLPALPFKLGQIFGALAKQCLPGARLVISYPEGREVVEQQQRQFPDVVISDLPDEMSLQNVAADHSFEIVEFVDEPDFYLAVLKFVGKNKA
ncbi:uncharacterized protein LOC132313666 [Cornus florida]|uniref:uncharacterized protein LOC132313666 n=1 Tax=Cornus florida TaxID=4283 RepID=UPI0028979096|nr:uncharacterized protein LOC132313666 [Cornus florida]XP_059668533.1 uncharacterized protein LOC132313666 [Cornus florida]